MIPSSSSKDDDLLSSSSDEIENMAMRALEHLDETKTDAHVVHTEQDENRKELKEKAEKGEIDQEVGANIQNEFGVCGWILTILSYLLIFVTLPISACMCIKVVQEYERAVIFRLGRLMPGGAKGPGIFFIVPCIDTYRKVDLRVLSFEVPPQEILSKDSVTVAVDAVVYFRISNATISVTNVEDAARSTKLLAQTTLRNILGTKTLAEMLSDREAISHQMQTTLDEATEPWGVKVERVEVKDVRLPVQLQRAMAAEAEAAREARAKVIVAEGEQKASRALKEAAEVIAESPSALQLRYLQTLNSISAEKNSTIIFPFPIDLLSSFLQRPPTKLELQMYADKRRDSRAALSGRDQRFYIWLWLSASASKEPNHSATPRSGPAHQNYLTIKRTKQFVVPEMIPARAMRSAACFLRPQEGHRHRHKLVQYAFDRNKALLCKNKYESSSFPSFIDDREAMRVVLRQRCFHTHQKLTRANTAMPAPTLVRRALQHRCLI
ncbi:hypothetical protein Y032_0029g1920 [Ancylostoma ceylanicum]|uniref:Band 7 domain-containing protein n=1 Tax=Ancylostoma ceylanicum TaxID=53326 RepID=A0A016USF6_9BILA|nr:hypothetical protein Y032_0029g1920 [Ancylostoma ceylanicum]